MAVPDDVTATSGVRHQRDLPARGGDPVAWPDWLPADVVAACVRSGIDAPWRHQREAADLAHSGQHVVLSTGTASGKSLGYLLPVLAATYGGADAQGPVSVGAPSVRDTLLRPTRPHTALYLAPTKALAHDQLRVCTELGGSTWRVSTLDGDSDRAERDWARDHASYVLSNPDMLHRSVLPRHDRWATLLQTLRYVVVDECHRYRGVFGAHVAAVLRRLRRLCHHYGADPIFVLASATVTNAAEAATELVGAPVTAVTEDASPHGAVRIRLWEPEADTDTEVAALLAESVDEGRQTVAFVPSRKGAELVALRAQERLCDRTQQIDAYRSGYLAGERRQLERRLQDGSLRGVAATNALELGVDIAGMDAVIMAGFPGTRAAFWQQAGRAGRRGSEALVTLVARQNPLDAYLFEHPELIFDSPVETTVLHADNPYVLGPHLAAAAQELPVTTEDTRWFGPTQPDLLDQLTTQGALRRRPQGWFWTHTERAVDLIDLRADSGRAVEVIDSDTGRVIGQVDRGNADGTVHEGAVYLHQGETWLVDSLDLGRGEAIATATRPGYYTTPKSISEVSVVRERDRREFGQGTVHRGDVEVTSQVVAYLRRDEVTHDVWDETPLDLPRRSLRTQGVWWTIPLEAVAALDTAPLRLAGAAHAAEHTAIGLLPLFAPCDRWDIGGLSTVLHPDTDTCTIFVHDGHPGGAGFAERGFAVAEDWLDATLERLTNCPCPDGCPACVVSPKCGNANQVLDKRAAADLVRLLRPS